LILPVLVVIGVILGYPLYWLVKLSTQRYGLFELIRHQGVSVGLHNYGSVLHDGVFWRTLLRTVVFTAVNETVVGFVVHSAPVLVVWYGVHQILQGRLTVGELTQFLLYLGMFYSPLQRMSDLSIVLSNALAAIERIFEYFDTQPQVVERKQALGLTECSGRIEFEQVSFGYGAGSPTLRDINLVVPAGQSPSGLPIGMQLIGRPFGDETLIALGRAFQAVTDHHRMIPTL